MSKIARQHAGIATLRGRRPAPKLRPKIPIINKELLGNDDSLDEDEYLDNKYDIGTDKSKGLKYISAKEDDYTDLTQYLKENKFYKVQDYILTNEGLFYRSVDKQTGQVTQIKISDGIYVEKVVHNIDDNDTYINITYKFNNKNITIKCPMNQLLPNELIKLVSKGADIPHKYKSLISDFINEQRKLAKHENIYSNVGWHKSIVDKNEIKFRHDRLFTTNELEVARSDEDISKYDLKPKGHLLAWRNMFNNDVKGNIPAETLICIGASSILVGYLALITKDTDSLMVHLCGNSTQGKTTGAMLAVSLLGNPSNKGKGLVKSWNGTSNAIINSLGGNKGITIILDELSMTKESELTSEVYTITDGRDKARLTDTIEQRNQCEWSTTVISTGEQSMLEKTNKNIGLMVRLIEFSNVQWTISAENAEKIREKCLNNYGVGAESIVKEVERLGQDGINELINKWRELLNEAITENKFKERVSKKLAIILATGEIVSKAIRIDLDLDAILNFLVENEEQNMIERDLGMKAFNQIVQVIIQNKGYFKLNNISIQNNICWGNINSKDDYYEVAILKNVLDKNLRMLGYGDPRIVVKEWKNGNLLESERDRSTKRVKIFSEDEIEMRKMSLETDNVPNKVEDTTYIIKVSKEYLNDFLINN